MELGSVTLKINNQHTLGFSKALQGFENPSLGDVLDDFLVQLLWGLLPPERD
jgi:hypothetical protein